MENNDICQVQCTNDEIVSKVKAQMPPTDQLRDLGNLFKVLGDHTRIRILKALHVSELCVCDLVDILEMKQSAISHQLRVLRTSKIVKYRKDGKNVFYSLDDKHIYTIMEQGFNHILED